MTTPFQQKMVKLQVAHYVFEVPVVMTDQEAGMYLQADKLALNSKFPTTSSNTFIGHKNPTMKKCKFKDCSIPSENLTDCPEMYSTPVDPVSEGTEQALTPKLNVNLASKQQLSAVKPDQKKVLLSELPLSKMTQSDHHMATSNGQLKHTYNYEEENLAESNVTTAESTIEHASSGQVHQDQLVQSAGNCYKVLHLPQNDLQKSDCVSCTTILSLQPELSKDANSKRQIAAKITSTAGDNIKAKNKPYKCALCAQSFFILPALRTHVRLSHKTDFVATSAYDLMPFGCNFCDVRYPVSTKLSSHMLKHKVDVRSLEYKKFGHIMYKSRFRRPSIWHQEHNCASQRLVCMKNPTSQKSDLGCAKVNTTVACTSTEQASWVQSSRPGDKLTVKNSKKSTKFCCGTCKDKGQNSPHRSFNTPHALIVHVITRHRKDETNCNQAQCQLGDRELFRHNSAPVTSPCHMSVLSKSSENFETPSTGSEQTKITLLNSTGKAISWPLTITNQAKTMSSTSASQTVTTAFSSCGQASTSLSSSSDQLVIVVSKQTTSGSSQPITTPPTNTTKAMMLRNWATITPTSRKGHSQSASLNNQNVPMTVLSSDTDNLKLTYSHNPVSVLSSKEHLLVAAPYEATAKMTNPCIKTIKHAFFSCGTCKEMNRKGTLQPLSFTTPHALIVHNITRHRRGRSRCHRRQQKLEITKLSSKKTSFKAKCGQFQSNVTATGNCFAIPSLSVRTKDMLNVTETTRCSDSNNTQEERKNAICTTSTSDILPEWRYSETLTQQLQRPCSITSHSNNNGTVKSQKLQNIPDIVAEPYQYQESRLCEFNQKGLNVTKSSKPEINTDFKRYIIGRSKYLQNRQLFILKNTKMESSTTIEKQPVIPQQSLKPSVVFCSSAMDGSRKRDGSSSPTGQASAKTARKSSAAESNRNTTDTKASFPTSLDDKLLADNSVSSGRVKFNSNKGIISTVGCTGSGISSRSKKSHGKQTCMSSRCQSSKNSKNCSHSRTLGVTAKGSEDVRKCCMKSKKDSHSVRQNLNVRLYSVSQSLSTADTSSNLNKKSRKLTTSFQSSCSPSSKLQDISKGLDPLNLLNTRTRDSTGSLSLTVQRSPISTEDLNNTGQPNHGKGRAQRQVARCMKHSYRFVTCTHIRAKNLT